MTSVVPIRPTGGGADDIPTALRDIAQRVENGEYDLVTTAALVLGHTTEQPGKPGYTISSEHVEVFGIGPRHDVFTVRGLLMSGLMETRLVGSEDL